MPNALMTNIQWKEDYAEDMKKSLCYLEDLNSYS